MGKRTNRKRREEEEDVMTRKRSFICLVILSLSLLVFEITIVHLLMCLELDMQLLNLGLKSANLRSLCVTGVVEHLDLLLEFSDLLELSRAAFAGCLAISLALLLQLERLLFVHVERRVEVVAARH